MYSTPSITSATITVILVPLGSSISSKRELCATKHTLAPASVLLLCTFFLGPCLSLPSLPSAQPAGNPYKNPSPPAPFRRGLLLDDLGRVPVVAVDQRPDPGALGRRGAGGGSGRAAARGREQPPPQQGRGPRLPQRADPHAHRRALRAGRPGDVNFPRPRASPAPPRLVTTPLAPFKGPAPSSAARAVAPGEITRGARDARCGDLRESRGFFFFFFSVAEILSPPKLISQGASETGLKLCLQSAICCLILGKTFPLP